MQNASYVVIELTSMPVPCRPNYREPGLRAVTTGSADGGPVRLTDGTRSRKTRGCRDLSPLPMPLAAGQRRMQRPDDIRAPPGSPGLSAPQSRERDMATYPTDHAGLEILPFDRCLQLLTTVPVGRISFFSEGEIVVLPVNHVMDGQDPVFCTARGSKLSAAGGEDLVAFEADHYDERNPVWMERPGQWPRPGGLRRGRKPAPEPPWPAPVGNGGGTSVLDTDTAHLSKRAANARIRLVPPASARQPARQAAVKRCGRRTAAG